MNFSTTTIERMPGNGQGAVDPSLFVVHLIFGYVAAQLTILGAWTYVSGMGGATVEAEATQFFETFRFAALFTVPPALVVGVVDGVALATKTFAPRGAVTVLLVLLSVFWIAPVGVFAIVAYDLSIETMEAIPRAVELGALVSMEVAIVAELLVAVLVWLFLRLWRRL